MTKIVLYETGGSKNFESTLKKIYTFNRKIKKICPIYRCCILRLFFEDTDEAVEIPINTCDYFTIDMD